jgi:hypothetical protein
MRELSVLTGNAHPERFTDRVLDLLEGFDLRPKPSTCGPLFWYVAVAVLNAHSTQPRAVSPVIVG